MPDPISRPPAREIATDWGLFHALCDHPHRVFFTTRRADPLQQGHLVLNRVRYICDVTLHRGPAPEGHSVKRLDDVWYLEPTSGYCDLQRLNGDHATDSARRTLSEQVVPVLHDWVQGSHAAELLAEGDAYWRAKCHQTIDAVELELATAAVRLHRIRTALHQGGVISDREESYIATLRVVSR